MEHICLRYLQNQKHTSMKLNTVLKLAAIINIQNAKILHTTVQTHIRQPII